jgi:glycosyltransferase involved in cell wall biosynthesis
MKSLICLYDNNVEILSKRNASLSLVLVCYNQKDLIVQSIASIIDQMIEGDEIVIIDDCSNDQCAMVAEIYLRSVQAACRVRLFTKNANKGVNHTFNLIPSVAVHSNIVALAGDDFYYPNAIDHIRGLIDSNPNYSAIFSSCNVVDMRGEIIGMSNYLDDFLPSSIYQLTATGSSNLGGHSLVCWNTKILNLYGGLTDDVSNEDDQLILRCTLFGGICISHVPIRAYRKSDGSMSSPNVNFSQSIDSYMHGLVKPLKNRIANYKANTEFLSNNRKSEGISRVDINKLISNYSACIECLNTTILLIEKRDIFSRVSVLLKYLLKFGFCSSIYYKQNFVIAISHRLFFYLKKKRYYNKFSV